MILIAEFVVDCSMTMAWCFEDEATPETDAILKRLRQSSAIAPAIWPLEVANVLRNGKRRSRLTQTQIEQFTADLKSLSIFVEPIDISRALDQILPLAQTHGLTPYDAAYLELALRFGLPLATLDKELRIAAASLGVILL